ncbi:MAG TPA: alpha/beta hydrolase [Polyangiales bacterium]|nr:alpha/beta hydrolase [Polyangiales bacterium]
MDDQRLGQTPLAHLTKDAIGFTAATLGRISHALSRARGEFADLTIERDVAYGGGQRLDIWKQRDGGPAVLFLHGGGFQQLDKQSHWAFSERFARMGAVVFNADYRLAPEHRHPAAATDARDALAWVRAHAAGYGADPSQLIVAGASAGANLALGLAITERVQAAVLFSGLLQVTDMPRLYRSRASVPLAIRARMACIGVEYPPLGKGWELPAIEDPTLDPLLHVERRGEDGLPPLFVSTGSVDNVLEDSLRLCARLSAVPHELDVLPGFGHAFQGFLFSEPVRAMWRRCARFLAAQGLRVRY